MTNAPEVKQIPKWNELNGEIREAGGGEGQPVRELRVEWEMRPRSQVPSTPFGKLVIELKETGLWGNGTVGPSWVLCD